MDSPIIDISLRCKVRDTFHACRPAYILTGINATAKVSTKKNGKEALLENVDINVHEAIDELSEMKSGDLVNTKLVELSHRLGCHGKVDDLKRDLLQIYLSIGDLIEKRIKNEEQESDNDSDDDFDCNEVIIANEAKSWTAMYDLQSILALNIRHNTVELSGLIESITPIRASQVIYTTPLNLEKMNDVITAEEGYTRRLLRYRNTMVDSKDEKHTRNGYLTVYSDMNVSHEDKDIHETITEFKNVTITHDLTNLIATVAVNVDPESELGDIIIQRMKQATSMKYSSVRKAVNYTPFLVNRTLISSGTIVIKLFKDPPQLPNMLSANSRWMQYIVTDFTRMLASIINTLSNRNHREAFYSPGLGSEFPRNLGAAIHNAIDPGFTNNKQVYSTTVRCLTKSLEGTGLEEADVTRDVSALRNWGYDKSRFKNIKDYTSFIQSLVLLFHLFSIFDDFAKHWNAELPTKKQNSRALHIFATDPEALNKYIGNTVRHINRRLTSITKQGTEDGIEPITPEYIQSNLAELLKYSDI